jgi:insulysin
LKKNGWANSLSAGSNTELADYETFDVTVGLTKKGLDDVAKVIEHFFSFLTLLRDKGIPFYVFNEVLNLEELSWRFSSKGGVSSHVQSLSTSLQKYPPTLSVAGPRRLALARDSETLETSSRPRASFPDAQLELTSRLTQDFVQHLIPDNALITVMSKVGQLLTFLHWMFGSDLITQLYAAYNSVVSRKDRPKREVVRDRLFRGSGSGLDHDTMEATSETKKSWT